jgi:hypothetical protein
MRMSLMVAVAMGLGALVGFAAPSQADDHLATAVAAGGLRDLSNPSPSKPFTVDKALEAPGQGSPLSGEDHTTPASKVQEDAGHTLTVNPAFAAGHVAPAN